MKTTIIISILCIITNYACSQEISSDTVQARVYFDKAKQFAIQKEIDSSNIYYELAGDIFLKVFDESKKKIQTDTAVLIQYLQSRFFLSTNYRLKQNFDSSLSILKHALKKGETHLTSKNKYIADIYHNIGLSFFYKSMFDSAMIYTQTALDINISLYGKVNVKVANSYSNLGTFYKNKSEFDKALEYYFQCMQIYKELDGEKSTNVGQTYNNIGIVYKEKSEFDLALEYYFKSSEIEKELSGQRTIILARVYNNIGNVYNEKLDYDKALDYYLKSLEIKKETLNEKNLNIADSYNNISLIWKNKKEYDRALEYTFKSLAIYKEILGEMNIHVARSFYNLGHIYRLKKDYDIALEYCFKSLEMRKELLGDKHKDISITYRMIANIYWDKSDFDHALEYYQRGIECSIKNIGISENFCVIPTVKNYFDWNNLLYILNYKAEIFADTTKALKNCSDDSRLEIALKHYQACDTLITIVRKQITNQSDKIALGELASLVYKGAIDVCEMSIRECRKEEEKKYYKELAFYFSERNKTSVLLEALAGSEALKFSGIPDSLLKKEKSLSNNIANYTTLRNSANNDSIYNEFASLLFNENRSYDSLILYFESKYPEYYRLKYNNIPADINQMQSILDKKTAFLSYFLLDSSILICAVLKNDFEIYKVKKPNDFDAEIATFYRVLQSGNESDVIEYKDLALKFYRLLFPNTLLKNKNFQSIQNLIIIPDAGLSKIPFECLLTEKYSKNWTDWSNTAYFSEMPYLVKKYTVSYSYSGTLFYYTFPKEESKTVEITGLNDWIAFAPVFDDSAISGTTDISNRLLNNLDKNIQDSTIRSRGFLKDGRYISPLPGTLAEVDTIFINFNKNDLKAVTKKYQAANEEFIKSGELKNYKYIHFATHGFVNTDEPELSGILLAQDTSSIFESYKDPYGNIADQNDGILYQSEIYNLELNSDLVVLSACETGLGKITSGEGVIGLTRALLYAGTKNIIVSLWSVSDISTSKLMIVFYENLLKSKEKKNFSKHLQKAKLHLIKQGTFAHPFFWSPFILIGK
jgi:CHAT domain-containing protein